jgi:hypothetical protein
MESRREDDPFFRRFPLSGRGKRMFFLDVETLEVEPVFPADAG